MQENKTTHPQTKNEHNEIIINSHEPMLVININKAHPICQQQPTKVSDALKCITIKTK